MWSPSFAMRVPMVIVGLAIFTIAFFALSVGLDVQSVLAQGPID